MAPVPRTADSVGGLFERLLFIVRDSDKVWRKYEVFPGSTKDNRWTGFVPFTAAALLRRVGARTCGMAALK